MTFSLEILTVSFKLPTYYLFYRIVESSFCIAVIIEHFMFGQRAFRNNKFHKKHTYFAWLHVMTQNVLV